MLHYCCRKYRRPWETMPAWCNSPRTPWRPQSLPTAPLLDPTTLNWPGGRFTPTPTSTQSKTTVHWLSSACDFFTCNSFSKTSLYFLFNVHIYISGRIALYFLSFFWLWLFYMHISCRIMMVIIEIKLMLLLL